jgi:hypothetical protein
MSFPISGILGPLYDPRRRAKAFTPTSLSGCVLWLDFADATSITQSAGLISQANDKSGVGNNATQATGAKQPGYATAAINGLNTLHNTAASAAALGFATNPIAGASAATLLFVAQWVSQTNFQAAPVASFGSNGSLDNIPYSGSFYFGFGSTGRYSFTTPSGITAPHIYSCQSGPGLWNFYQDLTSLYSTATNTFGARTVTSSAPGIGGLTDGSATTGHSWQGNLCEVLMYSRVLTSPEMTSANTYLKSKWGTP